MGHCPIKKKKKFKNHKIWQENEILPAPFKNNPTLEILESTA